MVKIDRYPPEKRSEIMSQIRGKNTTPELVIRKYLFSRGFRYRVNDDRYPGKPDVVLSKYETVIFVHGCFWHGHENCKASKLPETRKEFWKKKISGNMERDQRNIRELERQGWNVIVVWECEIKNKVKREKDFGNSLMKLFSMKKIGVQNNGNSF